MRKNYFNNPISKTFMQAFPKFKNEDPDDTALYFWETWQNSPFYMADLTEDDLKDIYNHLLAAYYNWNFVYTDDIGIALNVMHLIHDYYPNVKIRLDLVQQMRDLNLEEFAKSGIMIDSQGQNPKIKTQMDELIDLVDSQNASFQIKSQEQTLKAKFMALYDGVMDEFINRFQPLFVKLYAGVTSYIYENPIEEGEEE